VENLLNPMWKVKFERWILGEQITFETENCKSTKGEEAAAEKKFP
jgi:hypothetical protein